MALVNQKKIVVITDFDGTITKKDSNDQLFKVHGNEENKHIEWLYKIGKIGTREGMHKHFEYLKIDEETYKNFIINDINLDPSFKDFTLRMKTMDIPVVVVSGGFVNAIDLLFKENDIHVDQVHANTLKFVKEAISVNFYHNEDRCKCQKSLCGNCKTRHLDQWKTTDYTIVYVGDGLTDTCIAHYVDVVFAKDGLKSYCEQQLLPYKAYKQFSDIEEWLLQYVA